MEVVRQFDVWDKFSDDWLFEIIIENFDYDEVIKMVDHVEDDLNLYYSYVVEGQLLEYFQSQGFDFDTNKYDYFLSCYGKKE